MSPVILRGYVSHQIRGRKGNTCPVEEVQANCARAAQDMARLQQQLSSAFVPVELFVPGQHDVFVQKAFAAGRITEQEILDTDCDILSECDFLLMYDWDNYVSRGMAYENDHATHTQIPTFTLTSIADHKSYIELLRALTELWLIKASEPKVIQIHGG